MDEPLHFRQNLVTHEDMIVEPIEREILIEEDVVLDGDLLYEVDGEHWEPVPEGEISEIQQGENHEEGVHLVDHSVLLDSEDTNRDHSIMQGTVGEDEDELTEYHYGEEVYEEVQPSEEYQEYLDARNQDDVRIAEVVDNVASAPYEEYLEEQYEEEPTSTRRQPTIVECEVCGVILKHPSKIQAHMRTHTGEKPFECDICGMRFSQKTPMRMHVKKHLGDTPFECQYGCGKKFVSNALKNAHELRHRGEKRKGPPRPHLKPPKRRVTFDDPPQAQRIPEEERCSIIEYLPPLGYIGQPLSLAAAKRIDEVIESVASGVPVPTRRSNTKRAPIMGQCQICGLLIKHPSKIQAHMRTHTGERPFECNICGQKFAQSHPLRIHIKRKHTGERSFECTWECGMSFVSHAARNEHEKIVHAEVKRYQCTASGCRRMFTRRRYLMLHRANEHPHLYGPAYENTMHNDMLMFPTSDQGYQEEYQRRQEELVLENESVDLEEDDSHHQFFEGHFVEEEDSQGYLQESANGSQLIDGMVSIKQEAYGDIEEEVVMENDETRNVSHLEEVFIDKSTSYHGDHGYSESEPLKNNEVPKRLSFRKMEPSLSHRLDERPSQQLRTWHRHPINAPRILSKANHSSHIHNSGNT